jgi:hypothetical protein
MLVAKKVKFEKGEEAAEKTEGLRLARVETPW